MSETSETDRRLLWADGVVSSDWTDTYLYVRNIMKTHVRTLPSFRNEPPTVPLTKLLVDFHIDDVTLIPGSKTPTRRRLRW